MIRELNLDEMNLVSGGEDVVVATGTQTASNDFDWTMFLQDYLRAGPSGGSHGGAGVFGQIGGGSHGGGVTQDEHNCVPAGGSPDIRPEVSAVAGLGTSLATGNPFLGTGAGYVSGGIVERNPAFLLPYPFGGPLMQRAALEPLVQPTTHPDCG